MTQTRRDGWYLLGGVALATLMSVNVGCDGNMTKLSLESTEAQSRDAFVDPDNPGQVIIPGEGIKDNPQQPGGEEPVIEDDFDRTQPYVRRLTELQYHNTIRSALGDYFEPEAYPALDDAIPTIGFANNPEYLGINDANAGKLYDATGVIAAQSVEQVPDIKACVESQNNACFQELIEDIGAKLWRRPLTSEEVQDLELARQAVEAAPGTRVEQAEFIVQALLMNINTLYRTEIGPTGIAGLAEGERLKLSDYEIASALSYTLWNEPPDQTLLDLAAAGELGKQEVYEAQLERLLGDEKVASAMTAFYVDYLKIDKLFIKEKVSEFNLTPEARQALVDGFKQDVRATLQLPGASLYDPFNQTDFHVNQRSAPFFQVSDLQGEVFEQVAVDPTQRYGILTHPAFLSVHSGTKDSGIVKRGVFTLEQLLCEHLGSPPANISPAPAEDLPEGFDPTTLTTREALHIQHSSQIQCYTCHKQIDPAGFGFENYDGSGLWRLTEKDNITIDASGTLEVQGETLTYDDSIGYVKALTGSQTMQRCFTERLMTYVLGTKPSEKEHELFLTKFSENNGNMSASLQALLQSPSFIQRQIAAPTTTSEEE